jgi:hypothetical protein
MLADFTVTVHEARRPLTVQVKVYDNVAALRGAATKWAKRGCRKAEPDFSDTLGVCHRFTKMDESLCAIVRLAPPNIGAGLVAHEMAHAAVWMWEIHNDFDKDTPLVHDVDEWFCWVLGELVRQTTIKLLEKGIY